MLTRRRVLETATAAVFCGVASHLAAAGSSAAPEVMHVKKTASCGCCQAWIDHLSEAGFQVTSENFAMGQLMRFKLDHGITVPLASCHTGRIAGYTIEGHVPAREIRRLLRERPAAIGLAVPEMPIGSPGMESGSRRDAFDVLLVREDGQTEVYASYAARP